MSTLRSLNSLVLRVCEVEGTSQDDHIKALQKDFDKHGADEKLEHTSTAMGKMKMHQTKYKGSETEKVNDHIHQTLKAHGYRAEKTKTSDAGEMGKSAYTKFTHPDGHNAVVAHIQAEGKYKQHSAVSVDIH